MKTTMQHAAATTGTPLLPVEMDLPGQSQRQRDYYAKIRRFHRSYFNAEGQWQATPIPPANREWLWNVFAWLDGDADERDFASRLILQAPELRVEPNGSGHGPDSKIPYNIFSSTHAMHLLAAHGSIFSGQARARLENWARRTITDNPGGARADLQFHGYNDNMPAKATLGLILGGEYFSQPQAVKHGLWNLHQLRLLLTRRGVIAEHCSPSYSALTLTNLTEISLLADNAEARELATACCEHIWAELLAHYHAPTHSIAGPYSRAYARDSAGHLSHLHFLLWKVFGDGFVPNPKNELFSANTSLILHHCGDRFGVESGYAFIASCNHSPPPPLMDWLNRRSYPFDFTATTERGDGDQFDASRIHLQLHQTKAFALGTSNGDWINQAERWHVVYQRTSEKPDTLRKPRFGDRRHLTMRFLVNDKLPGIIASSPRGEASGEVDYTPEQATYHTLQQGAISLVAARPLASLAGQPIHRMGLAIILPEHLNEAGEVKFEDGHLWIMDGPFMMAVRPLGIRRWGETTAEFRVLKSGNYRLLFFPNYEGNPQKFTTEELQGTTGGFVAICASLLDEHQSWEDSRLMCSRFRDTVLESSHVDTIWGNQRTILWQGFGHTLEMSCGLITDGLRFATIDGKEPATPPWHADGLPIEALPFGRTGFHPNPYSFPYDKNADGWTTFPSARLTG